MTAVRPLIVIPARLKSTRLENKLLLPLHGKPLIHWICSRIKSSKLADFLVATDSQEIEQYCNRNNFACLLTPSYFENGTERVAYVAKKKLSTIFLLMCRQMNLC